MTEKEKAIEWLKACKETNYRHSPTIQGYIDMAISALKDDRTRIEIASTEEIIFQKYVDIR